MNDEVALFMPPNAEVLALPSIDRPRLYMVSQSTAQRWRHSGMYPAFRWTARAYRTALRLKGSLGLGPTIQSPSVDWALAEFLQSCLPRVGGAVVALGTPGPAQKITVQLWDGVRILGYLKYGRAPRAKARLEQEHEMLGALPANVGPRVLKYAEYGEGKALVTEPIMGHSVPPRLPLRSNMRRFLDGLYQDTGVALERHPWVRYMQHRFGRMIEPWLEPLADQSWPVVIQHGDFAPWNVLHGSDGTLAAIDWEYGNAKGFPHMDAAHYLLQVAALMRRWAPTRARAYAAKTLDASLSSAQADALVRLAAFESYQEAIADGHERCAPLQAWRRAVWEG